MIIQHPDFDLSCIKARLEQANARGHRQLILISTRSSEAPALALYLLAKLCLDHRTGWYGPVPQATNSLTENGTVEFIPNQAWDTALGREFSAVVIDAHAGFDCDAMAALSGTITAGGMLLLLTPPLPAWPKHRDPESQRISAWRDTPIDGESLYIERFCRLLFAATSPVPLCSEADTRVLHNGAAAENPGDRFSEQNALVNGLLEYAINGEEGALLITADRGRGKSAALGIAAARLVTEYAENLLICAHGKPAVKILYQHFQQNLPAGNKSELRFCSPDRLAALRGSADILFVDEAANIPLPLLQQATEGFKRTVFASTVQGYEGAGRGFAIRFTQWLESSGIKQRHLTLEQPVRWQANDPLEAFTNRAFLLDAPLASAAADADALGAATQLISMDTRQLAQDEPRLRELFGLLVQAHYKTRPNDLRHILDANNLHCFGLNYAGQCVAAALVASEGPLHKLSLRQGILQKRRRPTAHLVPQLLAQYTGMAVALDLTIARIVRIAVHPELQRRGLGSEFLRQLRSWFDGVDAMAAQFSASAENRAFWVKNGFVPCHQGARRHSSGGYRSMLVLDTLSDRAEQCTRQASTLFTDAVQFEEHDRNQAVQVQAVQEQAEASATLYDEFVLARYMTKERSFTDSQAAIARAAVKMLINPAVLLDDTDKLLLLALQNPKCHLASVAKQCSIPGRKTLESRLRSMLQRTTRTQL